MSDQLLNTDPAIVRGLYDALMPFAEFNTSDSFILLEVSTADITRARAALAAAGSSLDEDTPKRSACCGVTCEHEEYMRCPQCGDGTVFEADPVEPEPAKPRLLRGSEVTEAGLYRYRRDGKDWLFVLVAATPDGILLFTVVSPMVGRWSHLDTAAGEFCGPVSAVPPVYVAAKVETCDDAVFEILSRKAKTLESIKEQDGPPMPADAQAERSAP